MSTDKHYQLSVEQQGAVESSARAISVVASAGSGKTEVVARRVERLLGESVDEQYRVLALSYTVKAADELKNRFSERLGAAHERVDTNTVHGFAHSLLRQHGTRIGLPVDPEVLVRDEDRAEMLARWLAEEGRTIPGDVDSVLRELDFTRARHESSILQTEWDAALANAGAVDYGSMLSRAEELLRLPSARRQMARLYGHVIIDEAQNLTPAQYALLTALIGPPSDAENPHVQTMLVGDSKQSIVGFAGADPQLIGQFETEYHAARFELTRNFRSSDLIVSFGNRVSEALGQPSTFDDEVRYAARGSIEVRSAPNEDLEGRLVADWALRLLTDGIPSSVLVPGEPSSVRAEEIAVLARSAAALRATEAALAASGHLPSLSSTPEDWLASRMGKVAFEIACLRSAAHHRSTQWQLMRLLGVDEHQLGSLEQLVSVLSEHADQDLAQLAELAEIEDPSAYVAGLDRVSLGDDADESERAAWQADSTLLTKTWKSFENQSQQSERTWGNFRMFVSRKQRGDDLAPGVRLQTIHKAQGREYRAVAIVGLNDGQIPDFRAKTEQEQIAELRTFYVAVTRPSRVLLLTRAESRATRYGVRTTDPSRFLSLVRDEPAKF